MKITIWGVITGAALPVFGYFVFHWLALKRESVNHHANAANDFLEAVIKAAAPIPPKEQHWNNDVLQALPVGVREIGTAVEIYSYFLSDQSRDKLAKDYENLKVVSDRFPMAKDRQTLAVEGGHILEENDKADFEAAKDKLLTYAKET